MTSFFTTRNAAATQLRWLVLPLLCLLLGTGFKQVSRPARTFSGSFELVITVTDPSLPLLRITGSGPGIATHLGQSWYESQTVIDYSGTTVELRGNVTFTAANGDELHTSFVGHPYPNGDGTETIIRQFTVTGGTGRFEGASGSFTGTTISPTPASPGDLPSTSLITLKGTITY